MSYCLVFHRTLRHLLLANIALILFPLSCYAQTSESDSSIQPLAGSGNPRGMETTHHEAGSVEATGQSLRDKLFLREATMNGIAEMKLSELALKRAKDADVKQFARSVIADHAGIAAGLQSAAESQGVMLPTKLSLREQVIYEKLNTLSGDDFDREYIRMLAEDHHKDLREYRSEMASTQDANLRSAVQNAITIIHHHITLADQIAHTKGVQMSRPARVEASAAP